MGHTDVTHRVHNAQGIALRTSEELKRVCEQNGKRYVCVIRDSWYIQHLVTMGHCEELEHAWVEHQLLGVELLQDLLCRSL